MKVKAPFHVCVTPFWMHGVFELRVFSLQLYEHWIGRYYWDYILVQRIPIPMKIAVRLGDDDGSDSECTE